jgi:hypothetical protein
MAWGSRSRFTGDSVLYHALPGLASRPPVPSSLVRDGDYSSRWNTDHCRAGALVASPDLEARCPMALRRALMISLRVLRSRREHS